MKVLIGADCPFSFLELFKKYKYEAVHVRDAMFSATDDKILDCANKNKLIVVTRDVRFAGQFVAKKGYDMILVRLPYFFTAYELVRAVEKFLKDADAESLPGFLIVAELDKIRKKEL